MTNATETIAGSAQLTGFKSQIDTQSALKFITCGSVDDGKSTLIGRLLVDSKAVLQDHLAGVQRHGETDLALLTDGLSAEREQGITIDVAYRYFNTENRKFIIGDAPGHVQYTRNMVTAASSADAAVVLVDATKLDWQSAKLDLLPQTRRHSLLLKLLRVSSIVFAVNKLDAVADPVLAFGHIRSALSRFATEAGMTVNAIVPVSALKGWNVWTRPKALPGAATAARPCCRFWKPCRSPRRMPRCLFPSRCSGLKSLLPPAIPARDAVCSGAALPPAAWPRTIGHHPAQRAKRHRGPGAEPGAPTRPCGGRSQRRHCAGPRSRCFSRRLAAGA